MGRIKKGILGGFSGKVGTVVGANWKGIAYMRSFPLKVRDPKTLAQRSQRSKFALTVNLLKPMNALLRIGWKLYAHGQSPINAAVSYTLANAITGVYPDYQIDPSKVLISRGGLAPAFNAEVTPANGAIIFEWDDNSGTSAAKQTDKALLAVVNPAKSDAVFDTEGAERSAGVQSLNLPAHWVGDEVLSYIGFVSEDGRELANSLYLGRITVV